MDIFYDFVSCSFLISANEAVASPKLLFWLYSHHTFGYIPILLQISEVVIYLVSILLLKENIRTLSLTIMEIEEHLYLNFPF